MTWLAGQSGNPNGARKFKKWQAMLERACLADDDVRLRQAAEALLDAAAAGDIAAIKEVADRLDGKVAQQIIATDEDGRGLNLGVIVYAAAVRSDDPVQVSAPALPAPDPAGSR